MTEPTGEPQLRVLDGVRWRGEPVTGERQQRLLAALVEAGRTGASTVRLAEEIWQDEPPADPGRALQVVVSLRDQVREDLARGGTPVDPVAAAEADLTPGADLI